MSLIIYDCYAFFKNFKVLQLPEILCIHLKRFRHEVMFSSKISAAVSFPLKGLDMRLYLHSECSSQVTSYDLSSVICHHGTAGGGHYTCFAQNQGQWYEFDDQCVTRVSPDTVQSCEAYVLFYRKSQTNNYEVKAKVKDLLKENPPCEEVVYVSKQWICRFNTCAEPGPIDNSDFLCHHGSLNPERANVVEQLTVVVPKSIFDYLYKKYGGSPAVTQLHICPACQALQRKLLLELETFFQLNHDFQMQDASPTHILSLAWYSQWQNFIQKRTSEPPGPIDNNKINLENNHEYAKVNEEIWNFFHSIYGGGPEIRIKVRGVSESEVNEEKGEEEEDLYDFYIPTLKKKPDERNTINKNMYCHGEPMETESVKEKGTTDCESVCVRLNGEEYPGETCSSPLNCEGNQSESGCCQPASNTSNTSVTDDENAVQHQTVPADSNITRKYRRRRRDAV